MLIFMLLVECRNIDMNFMEAIMHGDRNFMREVNKIKKHNKKTTVSNVDGGQDHWGISNRFCTKYQDHFNFV